MDPDVAAWRRAQRTRLLDMRQGVPPERRQHAARMIAGELDRIVAHRPIATIGLYWPIRQEISLLAWASEHAARGTFRLALPVVVTPKAPLEYWRWAPGEDLARGVWNIPVPATRDAVLPDLVLAPLVGFDRAQYRLGYGGGYFDRTLAALPRRPFAVGLGYDCGALDTIFPQPHDIPMDAVLTERRVMPPTDRSSHAT